jgi:hypothetical protein
MLHGGLAMAERLRAPRKSWLIAHGDVAVYGYAVAAFWTYTTLVRVLVRALWFKSSPMAEATSPAMFALVHVVFAPALFMAHSAAYQVGLPATHRFATAAKHLLILMFVALMAKFAYLIVNFVLMSESGDQDIAYTLAWFWAGPRIALGASIELASLYCMGVILAAGVVNWRRYNVEAIARAELALDVERSRSMALRRQLDPHSLYNTLNAIAGSVRSAPMTAIHMLSSLGELLRLTLRDDVTESSVADEFAIAVKYLTLYQLRYPDKLTIQVELEEHCREAAIPPLLLQPLVENAALHGVDAGCPSVKISLQAAEAVAGRIQITISNTCTPATVLVAPAQSSGIGLRNTWERLQLSYGSDFSLEWLAGARDVASLRLEIPRAIPKPASFEPPRAAAERASCARSRREAYPRPQHQSP